MHPKSTYLVILLVAFATALSAQTGLEIIVQVNYRNTPLRAVFSDLSERYAVQLSYSADFVPLDRQITYHNNGASLKQLLSVLCRQAGLEYRVMGGRIFLRENTAFQSSLPAPPVLQTVRGTVVDAASKEPLIGANIRLVDAAVLQGTATDERGQFEMNGIAVGRRTFEITYLGYHPLVIRDIVLISGKELVLQIELQELVTELSEIVVFSKVDKITPLNEMASVSTRPFSIEEAGRYAASFLDPARMARTFAGVTYLSDLENDLVVRGNGPTSLLWRLEGIEIPNPNHYGNIGSSGGAISMLSSNTLANSEFLSGAFPAEYGNTISGVFDLRLRRGNHQRRETSFSAGVLGIEASTEGPFRKGSQASYLVNYRYSSIDLLDRAGLNPVVSGGVPRYQDLTFKLHLPSREKGYWTVFGLAGTSGIHNFPLFEAADERDLKFWEDAEDFSLGILGASNFHSFNENLHLKTILVGSANTYDYEYAAYEVNRSDIWITEKEDYLNAHFRLSTQLNWKISARALLRTGFIFSRNAYDLYYHWRNKRNQFTRDWLDTRGRTASTQTYAQLKYRPNEQWTLQAGLQQLYFFLNNNSTLEPRLSAQWRFAPDQQLSLGLGKHSFIGHVSAYLFDVHPAQDTVHQPFRNAEFPKALHAVLAYDRQFGKDFRLKAEAYYQQIYNVAVSINPERSWMSIVNTINNYEVLDALVQDTITNAGRGRNMGLELTLEKFFTDGHYFMLTTSLYDSKYRTIDGRRFNTRFNGNFILNLLGGKEFKVTTNNVLGINGKFVVAGGNRISPVNLEASRENGFQVLYPGQINSLKTKTYHRFDFSVSYTVNRPRTTHNFQFEAQNIFNRQNVMERAFNRATRDVEEYYQTGLIPNLLYRVSF